MSPSISTSPPAPAPIPLPTAEFISPNSRRGPRSIKEYPSSPSSVMQTAFESPRQPSTRYREESTETNQEQSSQRTSIDSRRSTAASTLPSSVAASQFANSPTHSPYPSQKQSSYTPLAPPVAASPRTTAKPSFQTSTRHQNFDSTLNVSNRQPRSSHPSKSPFKKALAALGLSEKDRMKREERAYNGTREEKPRMGPVESAREQGRRVLRYVKRKLNSKTPKEELPSTWEAYSKAYAAVSFEFSELPNLLVSPFELTPFSLHFMSYSSNKLMSTIRLSLLRKPTSKPPNPLLSNNELTTLLDLKMKSLVRMSSIDWISSEHEQGPTSQILNRRLSAKLLPLQVLRLLSRTPRQRLYLHNRLPLDYEEGLRPHPLTQPPLLFSTTESRHQVPILSKTILSSAQSSLDAVRSSTRKSDLSRS